MNYYLSRNNPHYSFAPENTINYSNARAQPNPNANGQNGQKSILEEIKDILYELNKSINSLNYKMSYLSYTVKNAKVEILRALEKKKGTFKSRKFYPFGSANSTKISERTNRILQKKR